MEGAAAPQNTAAQGEIGSISAPIVTLPPKGPEYKVYYVTDHQLRLIRNQASSQHLSFATMALGIFFTALATLTQVDLFPKQPKFFITFVVLTVVSGFASLGWALLWWRSRKQLDDVLEELKSQYNPKGG